MKFLKKAGLVLIITAAVLYIGLVFVLPNAVNLNNYKADIQKAVNEASGLNADFTNAKLDVTPLLAAGVKLDNFSVKLPDNSDVFVSDKINFKISLPRLLFLTIKVTKADIVSPKINLDIENGKEYKLVKHLNDFSAKQAEIQNASEQKEEPKNSFDISKIKIYAPEILISNYEVLINDLKTKDYLKLRGDELKLAYNNGKTASVKTIAELFINETKNITADIDIESFLPAMTAENTADTKKEPEQPEDVQFINLPALYKTYDLKADINSKLKIREKDGAVIANGHFNIDNLNLLLSGIRLPNSRMHINADGTKFNSDTELYITDLEKIAVQASGDYGRNKALDVKIKSDEIYAASVLELVKAAMYSADIKNDLALYKAGGTFTADADIKTDFKKLSSNGSVDLKNITVKDAKNNKEIAQINSVLLLDNSILKITDTIVEAFGAVFRAEGTINEKLYADIKIAMDKMPLEQAFKLFAPAEINKAYIVNSGVLTLNADITGALENPEAKVKFNLNNLSLRDKINGINYSDSLLTADFNSDFKTFKGVINNSDFRLSMNGADIACDKLSINAGGKDLVINPAVVKINNTTNIDVSGTVKDYIQKPVFDINAKGNLRAADIKQLLGADAAPYIKEKGVLPLTANISGDAEKQTITASVSADADNYITFADIKNVLGKKTVLNTVIDIQNNKLTIKDTGLFLQNPKSEIAGIEGIISRIDTKNPVINNLKIHIPNDLTASLAVFPQSKFNLNGSVYVSGDLNNPKLRGAFNAYNASIPELYLTLDRGSAKFEDKNLDIELKKLIANGSDYNIIMSADLTPSKYFTIKTLNLISDLTDADKVMKVSEALEKYTAPQKPAASPAKTSSAQSAAAANIPVIIKDGTIDIKEIKSGGIKLTETSGRISMSNNVFYVKNLISSAFKGKLKGDVSSNLVTSEIKADVKGSNMDTAQALLETAAMKDTLSGVLDFDADVSLRGSSYEEQVKTLKGKVNFTIKDGSLGPIGKIENLVLADNLSTSSALRTVVNTAVSSTVDTSKFSTLQGSLTFNNGIADINPITSSGDYMSTYIFGKFDVLKNTADMKLRGRLGSRITDSMGQLAALNPVNIIKSNSNINPLIGRLMLTLCEQVTDDELAQIPAIAKESADENTAKFQAVIRGDAAKPLKLVRSFKWLESESRIKEAKEKLSGVSILTAPSNLNDAKQQAKDILKNLSSEGTQELQQQGKEAVQALKSLFKNVKETPKTEE